MKILGGTASFTGELILYSEKHQIEIRKNKQTEEFDTRITQHKLQDKKKINKIPFIRGVIITFLQHSFPNNVITINIYDIVIFVAYLVDKFYIKSNYITDIAYLLYFVLLIVASSLKKDFLQLHGAEHMIANYYNKYGNVDVNDIDKIKRTSMVHKNCGSMSYGLNIVIILLLRFITKDFFIRLVITTMVVYEIIKYQENKIIKTLFYPFFIFGKFIQRVFFVKIPTNNQIEMAVVAVKELEKNENNDI